MEERFYYMIGRYGVGISPPELDVEVKKWDQRDCVLITYPDMVQKEEEAPLVTLHHFCFQYLRGIFSAIHILPFFPWSSDDGFSVISYRSVASSYGTWQDIERFKKHFLLMFDLVLNHCSSQNNWFRDYLVGISPGRHFFIEMDPATDLSAVVRPRVSPLLTKAVPKQGEAYVWTTFSEDQIDFNWKNPDVLFEFLDILFGYLSKGAHMIRLDAVAYLWKQVGTFCIHLPETHQIVKLLRDVLELVAPGTLLLTETNVPHEDNFSYFGKGDEAHLVYNFVLPPLLLHTLIAEDSAHLTQWAKSLKTPPAGCAYFNFTASHDGIGLNATNGILTEKELETLLAIAQKRGGALSYKKNPDGSESPYELNISYFDALWDGKVSESIDRFLCSQAIALSLQGIPGVYFHSLTATRGDHEAVTISGQLRAINRHKWEENELGSLLQNRKTVTAQVFYRYIDLLKKRTDLPAFHPDGEQRIWEGSSSFFVLERWSPSGDQRVLCVYNVTGRKQVFSHEYLKERGELLDFWGENRVVSQGGKICMKPYQFMWLG